MPLNVVTSQQMFDGEKDASPFLASLLAQQRQPPILGIRLGGDVDLPQSPNRLALKQAGIAVRAATESFDDSAAGNMMRRMLSVWAEFDREQESELIHYSCPPMIEFTVSCPRRRIMNPRQWCFFSGIIRDPWEEGRRRR